MTRLKSVIILGLVLFVCLGVNMFHRINEKSSDYESAEDKVRFVNQKIKQIITSEQYIQASTQGRKDIVIAMLSVLEKEGYVSFSENVQNAGDVVSFEYVDHTLGGVMIRDFTESFDDLPMN